MNRSLRALALTVAITFSLGLLQVAAAAPPIFSKSDLATAKTIKVRNEHKIMGRPGIRGVGIGSENGKLGLLVLVENRALKIPVKPGRSIGERTWTESRF